jgi:hypothetical protein
MIPVIKEKNRTVRKNKKKKGIINGYEKVIKNMLLENYNFANPD